jgi:polysaccharide export outer membrane protein
MDVRMHAADEDSLPYAFVKLDPNVVKILAQYTPRLSTAFANRSPPKAFRFGIGDTVSVTIFEAAAGGLFIPAEAGVRPGNFVTIPNQAVDNHGNISVPYAGAIAAKGKTPFEVQQAIVAALKNRAIDPQAVVSLVDQKASLISVLGDVRAAGRFPASASGERILDAITRAGGPNSQGYDVWVTLERAGHRASVPFGALVYEPANNIYVLPNDTIYLYSQPQTFVAFGAAGTQGQYKFDAWRLTLAEAVGKHGGLSDSLADPASVFLYRGETREVAERLGVDCSKFKGPIIPIIYNVNLRDPSGYFLAQTFEMRNKDVIYISNAASVETTKFLNFLRTIMATANDPIIYATNGYALKAAINGTGVTTIINPPTPLH